jgi:hypothetical protein
MHRHEVLERYLPRLQCASLLGYDHKMTPTAWKELSRVPYAETDMENSPFYKKSHQKFRMECRRFFYEEGIYAWAEAAEKSGPALHIVL